MGKEDIKKRILEESDYIKCPKYWNSLNKYLISNSGTVEDSTIARFLMISEEEVQDIYQECVDKLKSGMVQTENED